jgi:hypothetical protein
MNPHQRKLIRARLLADNGQADAALYNLGLAQIPHPGELDEACSQPWRTSDLRFLRTPSHIPLNRFQVLRTPMAWKLLAELSLKKGDHALARGISEHLLKVLGHDPEVWSLRVESALLAKNPDETKALLRRLARAPRRHSWAQAFRWTLLESLALRGHHNDVFSLLAKDDADLVRAANGSDRYLKIAFNHGSLPRLQRALVAVEDPNLETKARVAFHEGKILGPDVTNNAALVPPGVLKKARAQLGTGTLLIDERITVNIPEDGAQRRVHQWTFARTEDTKGHGQPRVSVWTDPLREELRLDAFESHCPRGTPGRGVKETFVDLAEPELRLYYGLRRHDFLFPRLRPGCVARLSVSVQQNEVLDFDINYGDEILLDRGWPTHRFQVAITLPLTRSLYHRVSPAALRPGASKKLKLTTKILPGKPGLVELQFNFSDLPTMRRPMDLPGDSELIPSLLFSTHPNVVELANWYVRWAFSAKEKLPSALLNRVLPETEPLTPRQLIDRAHQFAASELRYVGLEFGVHGFQPYPLNTILRRGFGDCKDKSLVLHSLLNARKIENYPVLVRGRARGKLTVADKTQAAGSEVVPLEAFNHAIVAARVGPDQPWIFLDPSASDLSPGVVPWEIQGSNALILNPKGPEWTQLPITSADENTSTSTVQLSPYGLDFRVQFRGVLAGPQRATKDWAYWVKSWLSGPFEPDLIQNASVTTRIETKGDGFTLHASLKFRDGQVPTLIRPIRLLHADCEGLPNPKLGIAGSVHANRTHKTTIRLRGGTWTTTPDPDGIRQLVPGLIGFQWLGASTNTTATFRVDLGRNGTLTVAPDKVEAMESVCQFIKSQESRGLTIRWSQP